jgi:uncharacterized membrane protein YvlD (DUF360 family)
MEIFKILLMIYVVANLLFYFYQVLFKEKGKGLQVKSFWEAIWVFIIIALGAILIYYLIEITVNDEDAEKGL